LWSCPSRNKVIELLTSGFGSNQDLRSRLSRNDSVKTTVSNANIFPPEAFTSSRRVPSWRARWLARLGSLVIFSRRHQGAIRLDDCKRQQTIVGADMDGHFHITLVSSDRIEKCYTQNATSPSKSIVATCYMMDRVKP